MIINRPRGIVPRSKGCGLPLNYASQAINLNVTSGRFEAWREPLAIIDLPRPVSRAYVRDCCWTGIDAPCADYLTAGLPEKTYLSLPDESPMVTDSICDPYWTCLGYPVPDPPTAFVDPSHSVDKGPDLESRTYRITYGTDCEEGPASCPSEGVLVGKEAYVGLLLDAPVDPKWGATIVRVYQSQPLWDSSQGLMEMQGSPVQAGYLDPGSEQEYFLVAQVPVSQRQIVLGPETESGSLLTAQDLLPAPQGSQVAGETDQGSLVVFWDKSIAFSERNQYWGFPLKTYHDFPSCVKDVKVCGDTVFVLTSDGVYVIQDTVDCKDSSARPVQYLKEAPSPSACLSCVLFQNGVLYSSTEGLAYVTPQGSHSLVSDRSFEKDDWNQLGPIRSLTIGCGMLILSTDREEYLWELSLDESGQLPADVTTFGIKVDQWIVDEKDELYFLKAGSIYKFNAGSKYMILDWTQAEQRSDKRSRVSALRAEYVKKKSPTQNWVSILVDGKLNVTCPLGDTSKKVQGARGDCTQLRVKGREPMCSLAYGQGFNSLRGDGQ